MVIEIRRGIASRGMREWAKKWHQDLQDNEN